MFVTTANSLESSQRIGRVISFGGKISQRRVEELAMLGGYLEPLPACNSRNNRDFVRFFDGRRGFLQKADILVVDEDVYKASYLPVFIANAFFEPRKGFFNIFKHLCDCGARRVDNLQFVGEFAEWRWNSDFWHKILV